MTQPIVSIGCYIPIISPLFRRSSLYEIVDIFTIGFSDLNVEPMLKMHYAGEWILSNLTVKELMRYNITGEDYGLLVMEEYGLGRLTGKVMQQRDKYAATTLFQVEGNMDIVAESFRRIANMYRLPQIIL